MVSRLCLLFYLLLGVFFVDSQRVPSNNNHNHHRQIRSPQTELPYAEEFIIQISPEISIGHFLHVYPSLEYRMRGDVQIGSFQAIYGSFDRRLTRYLSFSSLVVDVSRDIVAKIYDVQSYAPRHLARLSQTGRLNPEGPHDYVYDPSGGAGIDVYLLDTGVERDPLEFENRVTFGADFTGDGEGDHNGHGTCVGGIVGSKTYGVAKRTNLIDVKVINDSGKGKLSWVLAGLQFVLHNRGKNSRPSVVNMSLGTPKNTMLNKAVQQLISMNIPVIAAAGNSDSSACRVSPASADGAFVIGAFDDRTDSVASFSNWGQCVDAFAPGVNILSVAYNGDTPVLYSGTSVAAPIGAGLVAYFMGMGDSGSQAIQRAKDLRQEGKLSRSTFIFKPLTENYILYNEAGEPLW